MPKTPEAYLKEPYSRVLVPDESGGYSAEMLEFPGCFAEGDTVDEAIEALEQSAQSWIQAALDQGQEIPQPFVNQGYGGKVALRLPKSFHRKCIEFAERDGTSLNQFLVTAIAARIGAEDLYHRFVQRLEQRTIAMVSDFTTHVVSTLQGMQQPSISVASSSSQVTALIATGNVISLQRAAIGPTIPVYSLVGETKDG
jgi:predicted RNase H-like HicB family nuclease